MTTTVNRHDRADDTSPFAYKTTMDAAGDATVIRPNLTRAGGLGVANFVWHVERSGNAAFTLEVMIGGDWETDDRVSAGDIHSKVHHHDTPFEGLRITHSTRGSDDAVVRITSEWALEVGGE